MRITTYCSLSCQAIYLLNLLLCASLELDKYLVLDINYFLSDFLKYFLSICSCQLTYNVFVVVSMVSMLQDGNSLI